MHPEFLYHGSPRKLEREVLIPHQAVCQSGLGENNRLAVYATEDRDYAIAIAIVNCNGVRESANATNSPLYAIILSGQPEQDYIYIHRLPTETFEYTFGEQWISTVPIKPISTEKLEVQEYIGKLVDYATFKDLDTIYFGPD